MSLLRRLLSAVRGSRVERFVASHTTTVYVVEGEDTEPLYGGLAVQLFGEDVWVDGVDSDAALEALNHLGDRYDVAFSQ